MKKRFSLLLILILTISTSTLHAQDDASQWKVEDVISQESASGLEFSPDGKSVAWVKRRADKKKDKFFTDLYLTRLDVKQDGSFKTIQLTRGDESDRSPLFSNDGETIYFLSSRDKGKKLWGLSVYGGEPFAADSFDTGISNIKWMGDHTLAFEYDEGKTLYERQLEEEEDNTMVVEDTAHNLYWFKSN